MGGGWGGLGSGDVAMGLVSLRMERNFKVVGLGMGVGVGAGE